MLFFFFFFFFSLFLGFSANKRGKIKREEGRIRAIMGGRRWKECVSAAAEEGNEEESKQAMRPPLSR